MVQLAQLKTEQKCYTLPKTQPAYKPIVTLFQETCDLPVQLSTNLQSRQEAPDIASMHDIWTNQLNGNLVVSSLNKEQREGNAWGTIPCMISSYIRRSKREARH